MKHVKCNVSEVTLNLMTAYNLVVILQKKKNENKDRIIIFSDNMQFSDSFCGNFTVVL